MLDKIDVRIPYSADFRLGFRFFSADVRYEGKSSPKRRSMYYAASCDLRPFGMDAILHTGLKFGKWKNSHKLELLSTGGKSLGQMHELIRSVFDVDPDSLQLMRADFASDLDGITLAAAYGSTRVKFKQSANSIGELDYETVGRRKLEYFRYGKSPNCFRVYDKTSECKARFPAFLKASGPNAEPPTFEKLFGFAPDAIRTRFERQTGGRGIPKTLSTSGQLRKAAEFNPFSRLEIVPDSFPFPDPQKIGVARSLKLVGTHGFIERYGYQQARACLNYDRNAKRQFDEYNEYVEQARIESPLTVERILESYRASVSRQIDDEIAA
jgi:hypothetical protein